MTTAYDLFVGPTNVQDVSARFQRDMGELMREWARGAKLGEWSSAQGDLYEVLEYANKQFVDAHARLAPVGSRLYEYELAITGPKAGNGGRYPAYYIGDGVAYYGVDDWRTHDAYRPQQVFRTNRDFRYGNRIKRWEVSASKRWYDGSNHSAGFRDTRELDGQCHGYDMSGARGPNLYRSSESRAFAYQAQADVPHAHAPRDSDPL